MILIGLYPLAHNQLIGKKQWLTLGIEYALARAKSKKND